MTDRTGGDRAVRKRTGPRLLATQESRVVAVVAFVIMIVGIVVGGHLYGRFLSARDLNGRDGAIEQLQSQAQKLKRSVDQKSAQLTQMQDQLAKTKAALEAIMPANNTYNIEPNQSLIVADGHMTVGLVGSPGTEAVTLNINGNQQKVVSGQVIPVTAEGASNCQVTVQSFDMFKTVINATCGGGK